jgi:RimJ/RimL family protein N-acetyltransferase
VDDASLIDRVKRDEIHCALSNVRSAAVPRKLGFCHEATLRHHTRTPDGQPRDTMVWTLLAHEYHTNPAATAEIEAFDILERQLL